MPFFPPSLVPNGKVHISDSIYVNKTGLAPRHPLHIQDAVIYWPWLSWNEIDVAVGPDQAPIARATIVGEPPHVLRSVYADTIGSTLNFNTSPTRQAWEVFSFFDWPDETGFLVKKFSVVWCRLWRPTVAPPPVVPISGGIDAASSTPFERGVVYESSIATDFEFFADPTTDPGELEVTTWFEKPAPGITFHVHSGPTSAPFLELSITQSGTYNVDMSLAGCVIAIQPNNVLEDESVRWQIKQNPPLTR